MTTHTHYFPWTENDTHAYCGARMIDADTHSPQPTCPGCAARQAAEDAALEAELEAPVAVPLDAEEAAFAGLKAQAAEVDRTMSIFGEMLFQFGVALNRSFAAQVRR